MRDLKNIPASVNARLQNLAKSQNKSFQELLQYYGIERFLFRLSQTRYRNLFILKGGLIFYVMNYSLRRITRDIDFRGFTENSADNLVEIIKEACSIPVSYDGLVFRDDAIRVEEIMADIDYPGYRITFDALLGSAIVPLQIDIGFSDVINPGVHEFTYPVLLKEMDAPVLKGYPPESIISEKFQAMVRLVDINSRWKDFYDIWMLSELHNFQGELLQKAISATFDQRETPVPLTIPIALTDDFARARQKQWEIFLFRNKLPQEKTESFTTIVTRLRLFLLPPVQAIIANNSFKKHWVAGTDWYGLDL